MPTNSAYDKFVGFGAFGAPRFSVQRAADEESQGISAVSEGHKWGVRSVMVGFGVLGGPRF